MTVSGFNIKSYIFTMSYNYIHRTHMGGCAENRLERTKREDKMVY